MTLTALGPDHDKLYCHGSAVSAMA